MCDVLVNPAQAAYAGPSALTADLPALERAKALAGGGSPMNDVRLATGWFQGQDGNWRYEIDDSQAKERIQLNGLPAGTEMTLGEYMDHPALYDAYPELRTMPMDILPKPGGVYRRSSQTLGIGPAHDNLEIGLHESQHHIQGREGWQGGANTLQRRGGDTQADTANLGWMISQIFKNYRDAPGEIEARDTGERRAMTPAHREAAPPRMMKR